MYTLIKKNHISIIDKNEGQNWGSGVKHGEGRTNTKDMLMVEINRPW